MRKFVFILSVLTLVQWHAGAQGVKIEGRVVDQNTKEGLPGVTILIKDTDNGTTSDFDGNFSLNLESKDRTLVFSFIGYLAKEVKVGANTKMYIEMRENTTELEAIIVTGLNGSQNKRALNYAAQDIKSKDITETQQQNIVNSLQGKVAGVQVTSSSGSPGSSSQIVIRGGTSISEGRSNQPIFVVDGIIMDNSTFQGSGNRAMDINPDDIESMTVLKGPSAAALYGIGGGNGAVIITTKSGKNGKVQVSFGSTVAFDQVGNTHEVQTTYGRGSRGVADDETTLMWGPAYTSSDKVYDNLGEFFQTGVQQKYDFNVTGGNEKSSFYLSASNNNQTGIVPGESYNRFNFLLKGSTQIRDNLKVTSSITNIFSKNVRGGSGSMYYAYLWPTDDDMSAYLHPNGSKNWLLEDLDPIYNNPENPYWRVNNNLPEYDINRTIGQVFFDWDIADPLNLTYRLGIDRSNQYYRRVTVAESSGSSTNYQGEIYEAEKDVKRITSTLNLTYSKMFGDGWDLFLLTGYNVDMTDARTIAYSGTDFLLPNLNSINNVNTFFIPVQSTSQRRVLGAYGEARLDYKGIASIGVTGRNDWTSTISPQHNSFFYPSVTAGFVFTELLQGAFSDVLSFGKLRASWAKSGQDANPESLGVVLEQYPGIGGGYKHDYYAGNPALKPEMLNSREFGANMSFFNGRLDLDFTRYIIESEDMIIQNRISTASGWVIQTFNTGNMTNKGIEVVLDAAVMTSGNFTWDASANFSSNNSKLTDLPGYISRLPVTTGQIINEAKPIALLNQPLYAIEGITYLRNENGDLVLDDDGFPRWGTYVVDENGDYELDADGYRKVTQENVYLGNREPDWLMGITNTFSYKNVGLSFLIDIRKGGDVINATSSAMMSRGTHKLLDTELNKAYTFTGVIENPEQGFVQNDQEVVLDYDYFRFGYRAVGENFVEDGSWVKLRYVALSYDLSAYTQKMGIKKLQMSVTGRNLLVLTKYSGGDPENDYSGSAVGGAGTVGLDYFNVPATRGITFSLKATF
ncbi:MAG: SusC/RagA family TonB-linked outer membrane protein [Cyclobacteriaceae bacterium]